MNARTRNLTALTLGSLSIMTSLAGCSSASGASPTATSAPAGTTSAPAGPTSGPYTDGDYSATGDYQSPGGPEKIDVEVKLKSDVVMAVTVTPTATANQAMRYQTQFAGGIADVVVGKKIDSLKVDKVAGSSLTSDGFNAAIATIKSEAAG